MYFEDTFNRRQRAGINKKKERFTSKRIMLWDLSCRKSKKSEWPSDDDDDGVWRRRRSLSTYAVTKRGFVSTWASAIRVGRGVLDSVVANPLAAPTVWKSRESLVRARPTASSTTLLPRLKPYAWNFSFLYSRQMESGKRIVRTSRCAHRIIISSVT